MHQLKMHLKTIDCRKEETELTLVSNIPHLCLYSSIQPDPPFTLPPPFAPSGQKSDRQLLQLLDALSFYLNVLFLAK